MKQPSLLAKNKKEYPFSEEKRLARLTPGISVFESL
jgi:hypothetical protein